MSTGPIESQIINTLSCSLNLSSLKIINESLMHNVPEGSETHFKIVVITNDFNNLSIIKRHKLIYKIKDDVVLNNIPSNSELLGQAKILSEGNDITIVSYSNMVNVVKDAISSDELSEISVELIDLQTLSPLDMQTIITSVSKTKKLLVCQEAPANSSVGSTVISNVVQSDAFSSLSIAPKLVSGLHSPMPSAKHLETTVIPQKEDIMQAIKDMV